MWKVFLKQLFTRMKSLVSKHWIQVIWIVISKMQGVWLLIILMQIELERRQLWQIIVIIIMLRPMYLLRKYWMLEEKLTLGNSNIMTKSTTQLSQYNSVPPRDQTSLWSCNTWTLLTSQPTFSLIMNRKLTWPQQTGG